MSMGQDTWPQRGAKPTPSFKTATARVRSPWIYARLLPIRRQSDRLSDAMAATCARWFGAMRNETMKAL
jgi:hypothetical protein